MHVEGLREWVGGWEGACRGIEGVGGRVGGWEGACGGIEGVGGKVGECMWRDCMRE